jgi:N-acetyl-gamma-glutamyl-phosphate reductase
VSVSVFIDGAAGTTGLEIHERLAGRADLSVVTLDEARRKDAGARREALNDADVVVLCLPDDAAREAVALLAGNARTKVVDASTAHRVAEGWTYGFAELEPEQAEQIAAARFVANPGCYPTGFLALVRPLVRQGLVPAETRLSVYAASGYSGGGKAMIADFEGGAASAFRPYALTLAHKHVPEMMRHAGLAHAPLFAPAVVNTYRGMVVEVPLHLSGVTIEELRGALSEAYAATPLVTVADDDAAVVTIEERAGSDGMTLRVAGNDAAGQARLIATLDNLGKGAAGAAVQNVNLMAGLDMLAGLSA